MHPAQETHKPWVTYQLHPLLRETIYSWFPVKEVEEASCRNLGLGVVRGERAGLTGAHSTEHNGTEYSERHREP